MVDMHWLLGMASLISMTFIFLASMLTFFRRRPGSSSLRLLLVAGMTIGLGVIYGRLFQLESVDGLSLGIGCALFALAQGTFWAAVVAHGANRPSAAFADRAPKTLVTAGPYGLIRHPFYVAYVLGFAGGAALTGEVWTWAVPLWMGCLYAVAARQEERLILRSSLGTAYRQYKNQVAAAVPRWGAWRRR
ncbi:methyltransferase family protein [Piscinibacter defluvii]|uniref:methyltransferase family protein n=1 Tax=Piscinibacter defluvii TaxID=1796922 RepID=UPI000FDE2B50|nr:isoprenylcysteine carboxylmethyltransferase family protein [Piscinibacter defluvii]